MVKRTKNFADVIRSKLRSDSELANRVRRESFNADIAQKVYDLRTRAGLSQSELADRVGTRQSVISRIEDADYDGHSLKLLKRIADVLGLELRIEFSSSQRARESTNAVAHSQITVMLVNWDTSSLATGAPANLFPANAWPNTVMGRRTARPYRRIGITG
jgi:transcriptional regulator with XRE-family HTH domain